jgi:flagellar motor protein MotB
MASLALAFVVAGTGCSNNKTTAERQSLLNQNDELKKQLDAERARSAAAEARANAATAQATSPPDAVTPPSMDGGVMDASNGGPAAGGPAPRTGRSAPTDLGGGVSTRVNNLGEDVIEIEGNVLFDSGKASLKASAKKTLDGVVATIKRQYSGKMLRIEGHTDASPVKSSGWDDNWDLGAARARAVLLYLSEKGVSAKSMYIASFAANDPKSTKNMAANRRVEIVVVRNAK